MGVHGFPFVLVVVCMAFSAPSAAAERTWAADTLAVGANIVHADDVRTEGAAPPAHDAESGVEHDLMYGAVGAGAGAFIGSLMGTAAAAGVIAAALALGGVPDANGTGLLVPALFPATLSLVASPGVGAVLGALVGTVLDVDAFGPAGLAALFSRPAAAYLGAVIGTLVCYLPSWWVCGVPAVLALVVIGTEFTLPIMAVAIGGMSTLAGAGAGCGGAAASAGAGYAVAELFGAHGTKAETDDGEGRDGPVAQAY